MVGKTNPDGMPVTVEYKDWSEKDHKNADGSISVQSLGSSLQSAHYRFNVIDGELAVPKHGRAESEIPAWVREAAEEKLAEVLEQLATDGGEQLSTEIPCPNGCGELERWYDVDGEPVLSCSECSYKRAELSEEIREAYHELRNCGVPDRQAEVGARLMYRRNRREIAAELDMAPSTVDTHRQRVEERASVARRLLRALDSGEVSVE